MPRCAKPGIIIFADEITAKLLLAVRLRDPFLIAHVVLIYFDTTLVSLVAKSAVEHLLPNVQHIKSERKPQHDGVNKPYLVDHESNVDEDEASAGDEKGGDGRKLVNCEDGGVYLLHSGSNG